MGRVVSVTFNRFTALEKAPVTIEYEAGWGPQPVRILRKKYITFLLAGVEP
jgi:hypothetical protein